MLLLLILVAFLSFLVIRQHLKAKKLPPGPVSLPLIGNLHQLVYYVWRENGVVPAFDLFRKTYGDVFTVWLGPIPHVSITDYETAHEVFVKNGNKYKDRFSPPIFECISDGLGLIASNGDIWAEVRRFTLMTFRNMGVGRALLEEKIMDELDARCQELDKTAVDGKTIVKSSEFFDLTVGSVINSLLVGKRFDEDNKDDYLEIRKRMNIAIQTFSMFDMTVPVWFLKRFFPKRFEMSVTAPRNIIDYVSRDAVQRWEDMKSGQYTVNPENPQDLVDAFLAKMESENRNGGHPAYTMRSLKQLLGDLWIAGQDTTSTTLISGFNQLVNHPHVIVKIREELRKITDDGARPLSLQDRAQTHYLNATIAEIQRHASVLNVNFWRINHEPTTVKGYPVDSGAIITAQLGAMHVNNDIFVNPEKFYPERFIENEQLLPQLVPFGLGKRSCVGESIARSELYLMFGNLILRYNIKAHGALPSTADFMPFGSARIPDKSTLLEFERLH